MQAGVHNHPPHAYAAHGTPLTLGATPRVRTSCSPACTARVPSLCGNRRVAHTQGRPSRGCAPRHAAHLPIDDRPRPEVATALSHVGLRQREEAGPRGPVQAQHVLQPVHGPLRPHTGGDVSRVACGRPRAANGESGGLNKVMTDAEHMNHNSRLQWQSGTAHSYYRLWRGFGRGGQVRHSLGRDGSGRLS